VFGSPAPSEAEKVKTPHPSAVTNLRSLRSYFAEFWYGTVSLPIKPHRTKLNFCTVYTQNRYFGTVGLFRPAKRLIPATVFYY